MSRIATQASRLGLVLAVFATAACGSDPVSPGQRTGGFQGDHREVPLCREIPSAQDLDRHIPIFDPQEPGGWEEPCLLIPPSEPAPPTQPRVF